MKTSIAIACYFSGNRDRVPEGYRNDYLHFVKTHMEVFEKIENQLHKIYFVCTYDESSVDMDYINSYFYELMKLNSKIVILNRPNLGGSYAGWQVVSDFDENESDYIVFTEDDYALVDTSIDDMLEYYKETPDMIYLCQLWNNERYTKDGLDITGHAQMSGGMLNVKLYNKLKKENNIEFTIFTFPGKIAIYNNQVCFLEEYRKNNILIRDMKERNACVYLNDRDSIINFGNKDGRDVFVPITDWYPNPCPNLRYSW
jgi:GT2 family glycosyltransferase